MNNSVNETIVIAKKTIQEKGGVVVLPLKEYEKLCERAVPTYYLKGKSAKKLDSLVREGIKEYEEGKCRKLKSLADFDR